MNMSCFVNSTKNCRLLIPVTRDNYSKWKIKQTHQTKSWLKNSRFTAEPGDFCVIPDKNSVPNKVLIGISEKINIWDFSNLPKKLPPGDYKIDYPNIEAIEKWCLGWALGAYSFDRFKTTNRQKISRLVIKDRNKIEVAAQATYLVRDLINTPASHMNPEELAKAAKEIADQNKASFKVIVGENLLKRNFPAIHAIGRAIKDKEQEPRLIDIKWGKKNDPKVILVGKGVCFDTGGLNLKPTNGMKLMKKDMGGAANVLGLAQMIMSTKLPIQLRVLIPAVENNVSGNALRPLDIIKSRNGTTIEITNTDAEGRVILADALAEACSDKPDLIIDFATLTGAARVALGTEIPVLFTNDDKFAKDLSESGLTEQDPVWRLPLWYGYKNMILGDSADLNNAPDGGYAGAITAALFLNEFIEPNIKWAHIDHMAWNIASKPGRPKGGEAMGLRSVYNVIKNTYAD